jgi:uncharacterized membrane protein YcfT
MVFTATIKQYFGYIVAVSFIGGGNRPIASHQQTLSHNVVLSIRTYHQLTSLVVLVIIAQVVVYPTTKISRRPLTECSLCRATENKLGHTIYK